MPSLGRQWLRSCALVMPLFYDSHTHHPASDLVWSIRNLSPTEPMPHVFSEHQQFSYGIHPWQAQTHRSCLEGLASILSEQQVALIGEIGLDKRHACPWNDQLEVFYAQLQLANELAKPVLIHCVGAIQEVLEARKRFQNIPDWVIHGFRGGAIQAQQWLRHGFLLSFGFHHQVEALRICPSDRLLLETDTDQRRIETLYQQVADCRSCSVDELSRQVALSFHRLIPALVCHREK